MPQKVQQVELSAACRRDKIAKKLCCRTLQLLGHMRGHVQGRIQDFEMGGENIKKNQILFQYLSDKKKIKKEGGSEKGGRGVKIHPFHLPWIHA